MGRVVIDSALRQTGDPAMHVTVKTILNHVHPIEGFVYEAERLVRRRTRWCVEVTIRPHAQRAPRCGVCRQPGSCHGHTEERAWRFVPPFGLQAVLKYTPRRVLGGRGACGVDALE